MGILITKLWNRLFKTKKEFKIIILGLANAGKTTILYNLHLGEPIQTQPTIGSNVEEVKNKNITFQMWDLGGQETLRASWSTYFQSTNAVIFVVDSTDKKNDLLSKMELFNLLINDELKNAVFLIYANKQDLEDAMNVAELTERLNLNDIKNHSWHIQACSALKSQGLKEGIDWLTEKLLEQSKK